MVSPIVVKGGTKIPGIDGVGSPGSTEGGFFMHQYHGSRGIHQGGIEVVEYAEEGVGGNFWVEARGTE